MKLLIAVVHGEDAGELRRKVTEAGFGMTEVDSVGGFLRENNCTFLLGIEEDRLPQLWQIMAGACHTRTEYVSPYTPAYGPGDLYLPRPVEVQVGGATVWVLEVERFEHL